MIEVFSCLGKPLTPYPLVLLHGWGFDRRIWQSLLPALQNRFDIICVDLPCFGESTLCTDGVEECCDYLLERLPSRFSILGWSLGGMIATRLAIKCPQRIQALITVGSNLKWVAEENWLGAAPEDFHSFVEGLKQNFLQTRQHFCGVIARGDDNERHLAKQLKKRLSDSSLEKHLYGLRLLKRIDNRKGFAHLSVPGLHMFGRQDAMVPVEVELGVKRLNKKQQTYVFDLSSHAPFLSEPDFFVEKIETFFSHLTHRLDKKRIAQSFSKAANTYDQAAQLQRDIGDHLFAQLPCSFGEQSMVLDLGSGTGYYSQKLADQYPQAQVISLDLSRGMLQHAKTRHKKFTGLCADAESLPLQNNSIDILFSNLAIQWCQNPEAWITESLRVLKPGACAFITTFVEGTLCELKQAWYAVDDKVHVNEFASGDGLKSAAEQAGFSIIKAERAAWVQAYGQVQNLTDELKAIGAHNVNAGRGQGLTGRKKIQAFVQAYETLRQGDRLPATYQVYYLSMQKTSQEKSLA